MSQPRRWCYYKEDETFVKRAFDPQMSKSVEQAFMNFMRTRANGVNIGGAMFDFEKMVCMHNGVAYKLSPNGGYVPYKVVFGGDIEGLNPSDKAFLSKIDPRMIAHKWFWWDSSNGENPFCAFKEEATTDPKWTCYSDSEERKIEQLYEINSNSSDPIPYDTMFCLRFKAMHENARLMIQGRCDDENNPSIPDASKRRRPIFRASYCWCCDNNEGAGEPNWVPYPPDISAHIEEAFINNKPEADISIGVETYTVNFTQGIQFRIEYTFKKCRVKRFGTEIIDSFMNNVGCGYLGLDDVLPPYWDLQEQQFLFSSHLNRSCGNSGVFVNGIVAPTAFLKPRTIGRIQSIQAFKAYHAKKQAIIGKGIPMMQSTQMLMQNGGINAYPIDSIANEFYMWYYAPNFVEVMNGAPLRIIDLKT